MEACFARIPSARSTPEPRLAANALSAACEPRLIAVRARGACSRGRGARSTKVADGADLWVHSSLGTEVTRRASAPTLWTVLRSDLTRVAHSAGGADEWKVIVERAVQQPSHSPVRWAHEVVARIDSTSEAGLESPAVCAVLRDLSVGQPMAELRRQGIHRSRIFTSKHTSARPGLVLCKLGAAAQNDLRAARNGECSTLGCGPVVLEEAVGDGSNCAAAHVKRSSVDSHIIDERRIR